MGESVVARSIQSSRDTAIVMDAKANDGGEARSKFCGEVFSGAIVHRYQGKVRRGVALKRFDAGFGKFRRIVEKERDGPTGRDGGWLIENVVGLLAHAWKNMKVLRRPARV
jgi:hypothetical protein